ncbi:MAG: hypothetical protein PUF93_07365, partial [Lachnospiraceae bacterium]|nr:hypothetical protein [Lachnospiraceae bacterium]
LVYKRSISLTNLASGVQNWRFVYKYAVFNLQTSISPYKLASRITTQPEVSSGSHKYQLLSLLLHLYYMYSALQNQSIRLVAGLYGVRVCTGRVGQVELELYKR